MERYDVVIIGGGVVGLTQAFEAARVGRRVCVIDEHSGSPSGGPHGASARNFGMVWPIGLPLGVWHGLAVAGRDWWLSAAERFGLATNRAGSLFLAGGDPEGGPLEAAVMREFVEAEADQREGLAWLDREALRSRWPGLVDETTVGGLVCREELGLDPPAALAALWAAAAAEGVELHRGRYVERIEAHDDGTASAFSADGRECCGDSLLVCSGHAWHRFFPEAYAGAGVTTCKLQMLELEDTRSEAQCEADGATPLLATGLTLRHYPAFASCPSLPSLRDHVAATSPELDEFAIHLLAAPRPIGQKRRKSETARRTWIVGDSHEYDADPYSLDERMGSAIAEGWAARCPAMGRVVRRWLGFYAKQPNAYFFAQRFGGTQADGPIACLHNVCGLGMTLSPGLARRTWNEFDGDAVAAVEAMERCATSRT